MPIAVALVGLIDKGEDNCCCAEPFSAIIKRPNAVGLRESIHQPVNKGIGHCTVSWFRCHVHQFQYPRCFRLCRVGRFRFALLSTQKHCGKLFGALGFCHDISRPKRGRTIGYVECDITDKESMRAAMQGVDGVFSRRLFFGCIGRIGCEHKRRLAVVLLDFSITPLGQGTSVSAYVARCLDLVDRSGKILVCQAISGVGLEKPAVETLP